MKNKSLKLVLALVMVVVLTAVPLFGCASEEAAPSNGTAPTPTAAPSAGEQVIIWGHVGDVTGPYSSDTKILLDADTAWVKYVNEELGGINGIPVELVWVDGRMEVPRCIPAIRRWADDGVVACHFVSQTYCEGLRAMMDRLEIPFYLPWGTTKGVLPPGYLYLPNALYPEFTCGFVDWLAANWEESRPPRVGFLCLDISFGRGIDLPEVYAYMKEKGVEHVGTEFMGLTDTTCSSQIQRLDKAGADWIYCQILCPHVATIKRDLERVGLRDKIQTVGPPSGGLSEDIYKLAGDLAIGHKVVVSQAVWGEDVPAMELCDRVSQKYLGHPLRTAPGTAFFFEDMWITQAIEKALDKNGYPITGADVKAELDQMKDVDTGGGFPPMTFGPQRRIGTYQMRIVEARENVTYVPISEYFEGPQVFGKEYWTK